MAKADATAPHAALAALVEQATVHLAHPVNWILVLVLVWLSGVAVSLGVVAWRQARFLRGLGGMSRDSGDTWLYRAHRAGGGPALVGVFFPRIVLPADFEAQYTAEERDVMIAHEEAHRGRAIAGSMDWWR